MSSKAKIKEKKSISEMGSRASFRVLKELVGLYILAITCVMPFYFTDGYSHIGSDKFDFFKNVTLFFGKVVIPVMVIFWIFDLTVKIKNEKTRMGAASKNTPGFKQIFMKGHIFDLTKFSTVDIFVALYGLILTVSYLTSEFRGAENFWGVKGWHMGYGTQMCLVIAYFIISRYWVPHEIYMYLILAVSFVVNLCGLLNRFGIMVFGMEYSNPSFISTIGNINWFCGYITVTFFIGVYMLFCMELPQKAGKNANAIKREKAHSKADRKEILRFVLLNIYVFIGSAMMVAQGSMSGMVATGAVAAAGLYFSRLDDADLKKVLWEITLFFGSCSALYIIRLIEPDKFNLSDRVTDILTHTWMPVVLFILSVTLFLVKSLRKILGKVIKPVIIAGIGVLLLTVILIVINTISPGHLGKLSDMAPFTFNESWGSYRGATWMAGAKTFAAQGFKGRLIGVGPDMMSKALYNQPALEPLKEQMASVFNGATLTNAHNEWLTILVNMGLFGIMVFGGLEISALKRYLSKKTGIDAAGHDYQRQIMFAGSIGVCLFAYMINNIFSFEQAMNVTTMFVMLGMAEGFMRQIGD
ncbi:MAG: O-antigen ligase family protein [Acetatifactor sp.]|nr:O-antigen ligase family protein [Acetatifactor sp.]